LLSAITILKKVKIISTLFIMLGLTSFQSDEIKSTTLRQIKVLEKEKFVNIIQIDKSEDSYFNQVGIASHYGRKFHGRKTSSGERFDKDDYTAAHKKLPFGTILRVRNISNDRVIFVRVNDRGPFKRTRIVDVSNAAAKYLKLDGIGRVEIDNFQLKRNTELSKSDLSLEENYVAYSSYNDLFVINKADIEVIHSYSDFKEAVNKYLEISHTKDVYLCVSQMLGSSSEYIIGNVKLSKLNENQLNVNKLN
jgi:rare lipoprotein A